MTLHAGYFSVGRVEVWHYKRSQLNDKLTLQAEYISLRKCSIVIKVIYL